MKGKLRTRKRSWAAGCMAVLLSAVFVLGGIQSPEVYAETGSAESILAGMTTKEKVEQMLMVSIRKFQKTGGSKQNVTVLPEEIEQYLTEHHFGGVILFAENTEGTEQTVRLIDSIQKANANGGAASSLLIGIDQEGGDVSRLNECVQGPGNMALTATGKDGNIPEMYSIIGSEIAALGINVDFCPDADVNNNPANPIIGVRSFSDDPEVVAKYVKQSITALQEEEVITCPKHFPGHGNTSKDSHTNLPCIDKSYEELKTMELIPFEAAIDAGTEMIMTAHIQYPQIETGTYTSIKDGEEVNLPATLSKTIITDILRGEMGYEGVVVTDALNMDAIAEHFQPLDAMKMIIRAGADIMLVPGNLTLEPGLNELATRIEALAEAVDADRSLMENVNAAAFRILKLKEKHGLLETYDGSDIEEKVAKAKQIVSTKANHEKEWEMTGDAVTLVKNEDNTLPLTREGEKTVILTAYADEPLPMEYAVDLLRQEGKLPEGSTYEVHCFRNKEAPEARQEVLDWIDGADNVVAVSEMGSAAFLTGDSAGLLDSLISKTHEQGGRFILMSVLLPYDVARFQEADAIMIAYGARSMNLDPRQDTEPMKRYGPNIAATLYLMLQGEDKPVGKLPVNLPKLNAEGNGYSSEILYARGTGLTFGAPGEYANEWVGGRWYDGEGKQTYMGIGSWHKNLKGWWYGDSCGWYAKNRWQKIDGKWYYFNSEGYMAKNEYISGWWIGPNGEWTYPYRSSWHKNKRGWWYGDASGWFAKNQWVKIDGKWYYFDRRGYMVTGTVQIGGTTYRFADSGEWIREQ